MSDQNETDAPPEFPALRQLRSQPVPPPWLEERVASNLRQAGLLAANESHRRWRRYPLAIAAALILFLAGVATGVHWSPNTAETLQGRQFLLLLDGADRSAELPANQLERLVREYSDWADQLHRMGVLVLANKLDDSGRILEKGGVEKGAGPISGFFLIRADNYDQAVETARNCPHLRHGGAVEVRQIDR